MLARFGKVYSNVEVMKIATSGNCELFAQSGRRNPYKEAKLGVLEEGAWADMLPVDGDPTTCWPIRNVTSLSSSKTARSIRMRFISARQTCNRCPPRRLPFLSNPFQNSRSS